jgi:hypothetical protein
VSLRNADGRPERRRGTVTAIAAVALVVGAGAAAFVTTYDTSDPVDARAPVAVTSDARHRFTDLGQLVAASDLVLTGRVVSSEPGRIFGNPGAAAASSAIRSHVLTLRVEAVLANKDEQAGSDTVVLVEEEATLTDGSPVVVDGMRPSRTGDRGLWFLVASNDAEFPGYTLVNAQGRYVETPTGRLRGGDRSDPLVRSLERMGSGRLADAVATRAHAG